MVKEIDIAWLAGIIDGEGCFSVKQPVKRGSGRSCHQVWLVICNTSESMMTRVASIIEALGAKRPSIRRVWKGKKATRWQFWVNVAQKDDLLRITQAVLPYLTAKKVEGEVIAWFLSRACRTKAYVRTELDKLVLESLSAVKRNGGEAPAEVANLLREVIPSQAVPGHRSVTDEGAEGVETRRVSSNNNPAHECPARLN